MYVQSEAQEEDVGLPTGQKEEPKEKSSKPRPKGGVLGPMGIMVMAVILTVLLLMLMLCCDCRKPKLSRMLRKKRI